tara:strand:+ start:4241 stop:5221 length:981 start_codon:yes stop_codon:yes gene_type:complete
MILGIESTAHTFGIGIVNDGKILCNIREMYTTKKGGIIPMESAEHHAKIADDVFEQALGEANVAEKDITAIAFSQSPGLAPCLIEGMKFAKKKAKELNVSLVGVNHCVSHLEIGRLTGAKDPVLLYASGANTQIIAYAGKKYRVFGETLDIGIGNFIDNFARFIGQGFPGGPKVEKLALKGKYIELPYRLKGMDVAFSGILTKLKQMKESGKYKDEDLCFSLQETVFAMLVEASERALAHTGKKELLLGGGVGCNSRLQEMCKIMCKERGCKFFVPSRDLLVDNGAMIAYLGEIMFKKGLFVKGKDIEKVDINPKERTDEVDVKWK